jgi:hypothetical protein
LTEKASFKIKNISFHRCPRSQLSPRRLAL